MRCLLNLHTWRTLDRRARAITEYREQSCSRCGKMRRQGRRPFFGWFAVSESNYPGERWRI
jgi:hypothetical protein